MTNRRNFLEKVTQLTAGALAAGTIGAPGSEASTQQTDAPKKKLHILMRSSWGTDEPTRASFPFLHGLALADAGHDVQIFLTHDATYLMRSDRGDGETHRMAAPERDHGQGCGETDPRIFLRGLLPGPWGHG